MSYAETIGTNGTDEEITKDLATNQIIDFNSIVSDMIANKVLGKDFTYTLSGNLSETNKERAKEVIDRFINLNQLDVLLIEILKRTLKNGASVLTFRRFENSYLLEYNEPNWIKTIANIGTRVYGATIIKKVNLGTMSYVQMEEWVLSNGKATVNRRFSVYEEGKQVMWGNTIKLPKGATLPPLYEEFAKGVLPIAVWLNKPDFTSQTNWESDKLAQNYNCRKLEKLMNQTYNQMFKEMLKNQTRIIGSFTPDEIKQIGNGSGIGWLLSDFIASTQSLISPNGTSGLEIIQGDPKLSSYLESIKLMWNDYLFHMGISPREDISGAKTSAEISFISERTIETINVKKKIANNVLSNLFNKILVLENIIQNENENVVNVEVRENLGNNPMTNYSEVNEMISTGLMTRLEGIQRIYSISKEEAEIKKEEIDKEIEEGELANEVQQLKEEENNEQV